MALPPVEWHVTTGPRHPSDVWEVPLPKVSPSNSSLDAPGLFHLLPVDVFQDFLCWTQESTKMQREREQDLQAQGALGGEAEDMIPLKRWGWEFTVHVLGPVLCSVPYKRWSLTLPILPSRYPSHFIELDTEARRGCDLLEAWLLSDTFGIWTRCSSPWWCLRSSTTLCF